MTAMCEIETDCQGLEMIDDELFLPDVSGEHLDAETVERVEAHRGDEAEGAGDEQVGQRARD